MFVAKQLFTKFNCKRILNYHIRELSAHFVRILYHVLFSHTQFVCTWCGHMLMHDAHMHLVQMQHVHISNGTT